MGKNGLIYTHTHRRLINDLEGQDSQNRLREPAVAVGKCSKSSYQDDGGRMQGGNSTATHTAEFQFGHVTCFPHSSHSQKIFILSLKMY